MFRPLRTVISVAILAGALWAAFAVDLGGKTFAEHVDTISDTPEAEQLIDGTRATINPALQEVRDRVLGEYVEAPTWIPAPDHAPDHAEARPQSDTIPASTLEPETVREPALPGQRRREAAMEPPLPGRR